jgi:hypothetical protein
VSVPGTYFSTNRVTFMNEENKAMVSGTIKTQKGHFVRVESPKNLNFSV